MGTLFKNGTIITASDMVSADVLVEGEVITLIGQDLSGDNHDIVDCAGKLPDAGRHRRAYPP